MSDQTPSRVRAIADNIEAMWRAETTTNIAMCIAAAFVLFGITQCAAQFDRTTTEIRLGDQKIRQLQEQTRLYALQAGYSDGNGLVKVEK